MKRGIYLTAFGLVVMALFSSCAIAQKANYSIRGELAGLNNDSVIIYSGYKDSNGKDRTDTMITRAVDNKFHFEGSVGEARSASVVLGGYRGRKNFSFFLEKGEISMKGTVDTTEAIRITGTPDNNDLMEGSARENAIYAGVKLRYAQLKDKTLGKEVSQRLETEIEDLRDSVLKVRTRFVKAHPNSLASGIYIYVLSDRVTVGALDTMYNNLGERVKKGTYGVIVGNALIAKKRTLIGMNAPLFEMNDLNGNKVRLADYKGKYVLLDFWASWCVPCRAETPYLTAAYDRFKDKGFTILSVSMDENDAKWKEAIAKDNMVWTNISDLKAFNNQVSKLYGVQPIPDNFLIDPSGKIIARGLRGDELSKKLSETIK